ncbi:MAG: spore coat protein U domain-containing protein [Burkholderiaceae bacterium]
MKPWLFALPLLPALLGCGAAQAAITCSLSNTNTYPVYDPSLNIHNDSTGSITLICTRLISDPASFSYWVGIDQGGASRALTRQTGTDTLSYSVHRDAGYNNTWNDTNRGVTGTLNFGGSTAASATLIYYFRVTKKQTGKPAGLYDDMPIATLRFTDQNGSFLAATTLVPVVSILTECRISSTPAPLVLNYTSFSASAVAANTSFAVSCTITTPYTLALDATSGTLLGLNYTLGLSASSGIGIGLPQTYSVIGTVAANQSGSCAGASCSATQVRTITISY